MYRFAKLRLPKRLDAARAILTVHRKTASIPVLSATVAPGSSSIEMKLDAHTERTGSPDPAEHAAREVLAEFFSLHQEAVYFFRQLEVQQEQRFYHWITNRAIRTLIEAGELSSTTTRLSAGGQIKLVWHRKYRYYKRAAAELVRLVEEYAHPTIGAALGLHGEFMTLEGFARNRFLLLGREINALEGAAWTETAHNVDLVFERDGVRYGVEVKNTLSYMDYPEMQLKVKLCQRLGLRPVFVVRMMPKNWIYEVSQQGGFVLVLKYQLYPWTHAALARRVAQTLNLPVDAPRALAEGTMTRFLAWHAKNL